MEKNLTVKKEKSKKIVIVALLVLFAFVSLFVLSQIATSKIVLRSTIESIDDKKMTVMGVTAGAAAAATGLAAIPSDVTTPIANQIMQISSYLMIVVCVLVLEKILLSVFGYISFSLLIPIACVLLGIYTFKRERKLKELAIKLIIFALVLALIVPVSVTISDLVCDINEDTIEEISAFSVDENSEGKTDGKQSWFAKAWDKIKDSTAVLATKSKGLLNSITDTIATFIVAYCIIPVLVVFVLFWLMNRLFSIPMPTIKMKNISPKFGEQKKLEEKTNAEK